jgi:hypothetical protein
VKVFAVALAFSLAGCGLFLSDPKEGAPDAGEGEAGTSAEGAGAEGGGAADDGGGVRGGQEGGDGSGRADSSAESSTGGATQQTTCSKNGSACTCDPPGDAGAGNSVVCDESVGLGAICCASATWPAPGSRCSCLTASCNRPGGGGCDCTLGSAGDTCNDGTMCCVVPGGGDCQCTYQGTTCYDGYRQVQKCDGQAISCGPNRQVASCSMP